MKVTWVVAFHDEFDLEFDALSEAVQDEVLAHARIARAVWTATR
jgi:hypothetical protein